MANFEEVYMFKNFLSYNLKPNEFNDFIDCLYKSEGLNLDEFCNEATAESFFYNAFDWTISEYKYNFWDIINSQWHKRLQEYKSGYNRTKQLKCNSIW